MIECEKRGNGILKQGMRLGETHNCPRCKVAEPLNLDLN